jgi:hypothetical protein
MIASSAYIFILFDDGKIATNIISKIIIIHLAHKTLYISRLAATHFLNIFVALQQE